MADPDDIPLDITGHGERTPPSESTDSGPDAPGTDPDDTAETGTETDPADPGTGETADGAGDTGGATEPRTDESDEPADGETDGEADVEPVEVLVQLAEDGEIDPWDIDIVAVTDKFLARLDGADLRAGGRALFYASVLLRLKGDAMLDEDDEEAEPEPWEQALSGGRQPEEVDEDPFAALDHEMDRRLERKRARGMPQTLDELVRELREAERGTWWKESREYDTGGTDSRSGPQELDYHATDEFRMDDEPTAADVTERTHGEDVEVIVDEVAAALRERYDQGRVEVLFREVETVAGSRVETFLGLLFLAHRGEIRLRQDELFGDLWIQDPAAVGGSDEAVAD
jgi:segregation and condensation protein A